MTGERPFSRGWTEHAAERAKERFGVDVTDEQWREAVMAIWDTVAGGCALALFLGALPAGKEAWAVRLAGHDVRVIYDPATACIVTVTGMQRRAIGAHRHHKRPPQFINGRLRRERPRRNEDFVIADQEDAK